MKSHQHSTYYIVFCYILFLEKRLTPNAASPVQELKSSPPTKKSTPRRPVSQQTPSNKSPLTGIYLFLFLFKS
jgi:hypothetical protein